MRRFQSVSPAPFCCAVADPAPHVRRFSGHRESRTLPSAAPSLIPHRTRRFSGRESHAIPSSAPSLIPRHARRFSVRCESRALPAAPSLIPHPARRFSERESRTLPSAVPSLIPHRTCVAHVGFQDRVSAPPHSRYTVPDPHQADKIHDAITPMCSGFPTISPKFLIIGIQSCCLPSIAPTPGIITVATIIIHHATLLLAHRRITAPDAIQDALIQYSKSSINSEVQDWLAEFPTAERDEIIQFIMEHQLPMI
ncbi:hypothetical protein MVEN_01694400 [Mycena venus]|uniref:Uncharacterized protein n=1 Tax=Mycena venus TaxID=2733690 RepID=A0A8H7CNA4_9AGAR|nr:hypothetical protein MVEN_01694400 [Mycena venus]